MPVYTCIILDSIEHCITVFMNLVTNFLRFHSDQNLFCCVCPPYCTSTRCCQLAGSVCQVYIKKSKKLERCYTCRWRIFIRDVSILQVAAFEAISTLVCHLVTFLLYLCPHKLSIFLHRKLLFSIHSCFLYTQILWSWFLWIC
jgi:hypothetical protein